MNNDQKERVEFETTCGDCKKKCTVPFVPKGDAPVLCKDCFSAKRADRPRNDRGGRRENLGSSNSQQMRRIEAIDAKMDKVMAMLEAIASHMDIDMNEGDRMSVLRQGLKGR